MISIVFSTYNGKQTLPIMLKAFTNLVIPKGGWELIAVDNNSTDNTKPLLQEYESLLPLTILFERNNGKNHALNKALNYIQGDIIVFTDDDIIPQPDWLIKIRETADKNTSFSIFGGKIEPYWNTPPNLWNTDWINQGIVYAITSESNDSGEISAGKIWGPNMVIRRHIFDKGFKFNTKIGPNGTNTYAMGSETSFTFMLEKKGYKCWFEPSMVVKHIIRENQMSSQWVLSRAIRFGKGEVKKLDIEYERENNIFLFGAPRYLYKKIMIQYLKLFKSYINNNPKEYFKIQWEINFLKGILLGFIDK